MPPPGVMPLPGMLPQGTPPFQPGMSRPPLGPPPAFVPAGSPFTASGINGTGTPTTPVVGSGTHTPVPMARSVPPIGSVSIQNQPPALALPNAALEQKYTPFKKKTELKYPDPNFSPVRPLHFLVWNGTDLDLSVTQEEKRAHTTRYYFAKESTNTAPSPSAITGLAPEEMRGKKRARAEDFL